ncbi:hypothetical protein GCM10027051_31520 [Niabella terrae]
MDKKKSTEKSVSPAKKKVTNPRRAGSSDMKTTHPEISERFKKFVHDSGLTYNDLQDVLGIKKSTLHSYAQGRATPGIYLLQQLNVKFGVSYDYMIDGVDSSTNIIDILSQIENLKLAIKKLKVTGRFS